MRALRYISVCSGIEAASVAWGPLGWTPIAFSEIEPFPCAVLAHRFPHVPNLGDMTKFKEWPDAAVDVLVGGTPCQSFSVAGLRKGLADPRGNLTLTYLAMVARYRPRWTVWENVPGVLSDKTGAFASFVGGLAELGYWWAYRVLDAQFFGVPQRRRRVFVVGHLGDWRRPAAALSERESLLGNPPPRRESRQGTAGTLAARTRGGGGLGTDFDLGGGLICGPEISPALKSRDFKGPSSDGDGDGAPLIVHSLRGDGFDASEDGTGRGTPLVPDVYPCLRSGNPYNNSDPGMEASMLVALDTTQITSAANRCNPQPGGPCHPLAAEAHPPAVAFQTRVARNGRGQPKDIVDSLTEAASGTHADSKPHVAYSGGVRRLTPRECERLQGFPDDWTLVTYRGKPASDGPRYKAIGNSFAVPVVRWIGQRLQAIEGIANGRDQGVRKAGSVD